jgi:acetyl-CoA carboxylase biotin carboxyl carrier protein
MDLEEIKQLLDLVREHELAEFELERDGMKIRVRKDLAAAVRTAGPGGTAPAEASTGDGAVQTPAGRNPSASPAPPFVPGPTDLESAEAGIEVALIKSPIVGTFYRSPDPSAPAFVEVGDTVRKGQVLCIIEAMKLMNEIESEYDGEVVSIYVENGQPVQYGERLFAIRTR